MAPTLLSVRCNPYGAEDGGPRRVMGGLHGPGSAATPDMDLPENVAQGEWLCQQLAQVRAYLECKCGHRGTPMPLCSWHDEIVYHAEMVAGVARQVSTVERVRGHFEEIQRRQSRSCIRCLFPAGPGYDFAQLYKDMFAYQNELSYLLDRMGPAAWHSARARQMQQRLDDMRAEFDQGIDRKLIHNCAMTLRQVS